MYSVLIGYINHSYIYLVHTFSINFLSQVIWNMDTEGRYKLIRLEIDVPGCYWLQILKRPTNNIVINYRPTTFKHLILYLFFVSIFWYCSIILYWYIYTHTKKPFILNCKWVVEDLWKYCKDLLSYDMNIFLVLVHRREREGYHSYFKHNF